MARPTKSSTHLIQYKGVSISLYLNSRGGWEASFTIPGRKREKSSGPSQAQCQANAQEKIRGVLGTEERAFHSDEQEARALLFKHGVTLTEAARFWLKEHSIPIKEVTVAELRERWLAHRKSTGKFHQMRSLKHRTVKLVEQFGGTQIGRISVLDLTNWQDLLLIEYQPRTARNIHDACKDLWRFGRKRGYLPPDRISAMEQIDRPTVRNGKIEIFTVDEMQKLLNAAWSIKSPAAAAMAIGAFGFLRSEELYSKNPEEPLDHRVAWEDIRWDENYIHIREEIAKTAVRREAGLPANLKAMLKPLGTIGPIYSQARLDIEYAKIAKLAGIKWKCNALRHSCITYAMVLAPNATEVADKAGNSVQIIESNYRKRGVRKEEAEAWRNLKPTVSWGAESSTGAEETQQSGTVRSKSISASGRSRKLPVLLSA